MMEQRPPPGNARERHANHEHASPMRIGLISDTHGLLRSEALAALQGSDFIVHAGDIGDASILVQLAAIAPVTAVRGNNDAGAWAARLPDTSELDAGGIHVLVIHDLATLAVDPKAARIDVIVSGHSHQPSVVQQDDVLFVNPGSAGPRRFRLPVSIGMLTISAGAVEAELIPLDIAASPGRRRASRSAADRG
jgi:uncharacterized protein